MSTNFFVGEDWASKGIDIVVGNTHLELTGTMKTAI